MDIGGYRDNYESFYEKFTYQISINRGRITTTHVSHASLVRILTSYLSLLVKRFEEEIQPSRDRLDIARG